jgi:hypothetical protein
VDRHTTVSAPEPFSYRPRAFVGQLGSARLTAGRGTMAAVFAVLNWGLDAVCLRMFGAGVPGGPPKAQVKRSSSGVQASAESEYSSGVLQ